jgi:hypothetical protein
VRPFLNISRGELRVQQSRLLLSLSGPSHLLPAPNLHLAPKASKARRGPKVLRASKAHRDRKALKASKGFRGRRDRRAQRESKARQGRRGFRVRKANKALLARPVRQHQPACMLSGRISVMASATSFVTRARLLLL